jgi:hypothetical protein
MSKNITDTDRINWLIKNNADIEAPEPPDNYTWIIYTPQKALGSGVSCARDLRTAIDQAIDES